MRGCGSVCKGDQTVEHEPDSLFLRERVAVRCQDTPMKHIQLNYRMALRVLDRE